MSKKTTKVKTLHRVFVKKSDEKDEAILLKKTNFKLYDEIYENIYVTLCSKFQKSPELKLNFHPLSNVVGSSSSSINYIVYKDSTTNFPVLEFIITFDSHNYKKVFEAATENDTTIDVRKGARRNWMESITRELSFGCHIYKFNDAYNYKDDYYKYLFLLGISNENDEKIYNEFKNQYEIYGLNKNDEIVNFTNEIPFEKSSNIFAVDQEEGGGGGEASLLVYFLVRYHVITAHPMENEYAPWLTSPHQEDIAILLCKEFDIHTSILGGKDKMEEGKGKKKRKRGDSSSPPPVIFDEKDNKKPAKIIDVEKTFGFFFNFFYNVIEKNNKIILEEKTNSHLSNISEKSFSELHGNLLSLENIVDEYIFCTFESYTLDLLLSNESSSSSSSSSSSMSKTVNLEKKQNIESKWKSFMIESIPKNPKFFHFINGVPKLKKLFTFLKYYDDPEVHVEWQTGIYNKEANQIQSEKGIIYKLTKNEDKCLLSNQSPEHNASIPFVQISKSNQIFVLADMEKKQIYDMFYKVSNIFYSIQDYMKEDEVSNLMEEEKEENLLNNVINTFLKVQMNNSTEEQQFLLSNISFQYYVDGGGKNKKKEKQQEKRKKKNMMINGGHLDPEEELFYALFDSVYIENPRIENLIKLERNRSSSLHKNVFNLKKMNLIFTSFILMNIKTIAYFSHQLLLKSLTSSSNKQ